MKKFLGFSVLVVLLCVVGMFFVYKYWVIPDIQAKTRAVADSTARVRGFDSGQNVLRNFLADSTKKAIVRKKFVDDSVRKASLSAIKAKHEPPKQNFHMKDGEIDPDNPDPY